MSPLTWGGWCAWTMQVALDKYTNRLEADSSMQSPLEKAVSTPDKRPLQRFAPTLALQPGR